jgi:glycine cleavage system H lipoate-binding protein/ABC-type phosphate transport system substrate-binding protein
MKNLVALTTGILGLCCALITLQVNAEEKTGDKKETVYLYYSPDMKDLALQWASEYQMVNKNIAIQPEIIRQWQNQIPEPGKSDIVLITNEAAGKITDDTYWKSVIGRDVVVPVINAENPHSGLIRHVGFTTQQLAGIFSKGGPKSWGMPDNTNQNDPVHIYVSDDEGTQQKVAGYLSLSPDDLDINGRMNASEMVESIINDKFGIGWCKLSDVTDPETGNLVGGISLVPIDRNGNGRIDHFENIYSGVNDFNRGVWIGKYPHQLVTNIYVVMPVAGLETAGSEFVKWTITGGQETLASLGHSAMLSIEKTNVLDDMARPENLARISGGGLSLKAMVFIIIGGVALIIFIIALIAGRSKGNAESSEEMVKGDGGFINGDSITLPGGMYFDKTHTWAFMEKEGKLRIGIDDFLQHITGTFTRVSMKSPGEKIKKNEHLVTLIHEGKQLSLYSPVSGTIAAINASIEENPSLINTSPYDQGWLYMIEPSNWLREVSFLHMAEKHMAWLKSEFARLKDFLATKLQAGQMVNQGIVLQEGGRLKDHVLADLDPEIWEDFQKCFIDRPV